MTSGTSGRSRGPLTRELIVEAALDIVDTDGLSALSMRRLARALGVEAASLYHHVPSKDALLDALVVRIRSEMSLPDPLPADWPGMMEAIFAEYRRVLVAHPAAIPLAGRRVETDPDSGLMHLLTLGFDLDDAVDLWQSIIAFVVGFSMLGGSVVPMDDEDLSQEVRRRFGQWREETFHRSLRMLVDGYAAVLPPRPTPG